MAQRLMLKRRAELVSKLLEWYDAHRRDLPWRRTNKPYRIWVSEIMLQQTRVAAAIDYYRRFLGRFPTVSALARSSESEVLAQWSGLGYYRRARRLHLAAKEIHVKHRGRLPKTSEEWKQLPGIGRYTAAAIASIAFGERVAVVDGNVERVLRRLSGKMKLDCWEAAQQLIPTERPGDFNQAVMELGAMVCTSTSPACADCPLRRWCKTRGEHQTATPPRRQRAGNEIAVHRRDGSVYLIQRAANASLMAGLWEFPPAVPAKAAPLLRLKHAITTTDYHVSVFAQAGRVSGGRWVPIPSLPELPLTGLTRKVLRRLNLIA